MSTQYPTTQKIARTALRSAAAHWLRLLVTTLVGALALGAVGFALSRGGSSTATVFVAPLESSPFSPDPRGQTVTNLETEAQVAKSDDVLARAASALGGGVSVEQLTTALAVTVPPGAQVLSLTVQGSDTLDPKTAVDAVANSYLDVRQERAVASIAEQRATINTAQREAKRQLADAAARVADRSPGSPGRQVAEQELNVATGTLAALAQSRATLAGVATYPGEVLAPGTDARARLPILPAAAGAVLGFLIGLVWSLRIDRRRTVEPTVQAAPAPSWAGGP